VTDSFPSWNEAYASDHSATGPESHIISSLNVHDKVFEFAFPDRCVYAFVKTDFAGRIQILCGDVKIICTASH